MARNLAKLLIGIFLSTFCIVALGASDRTLYMDNIYPNTNAGIKIGPVAQQTISLPNDPIAGTTLNKLASYTAINHPATGTVTVKTHVAGSSDDIIGIVVAGAGTTGNATIAVGGIATCVFDSSLHGAPQYVKASTSVNGDCAGGGITYPTAGNAIGYTRVTTTSAGSSDVELFHGTPLDYLSASNIGEGTILGSILSNSIDNISSTQGTILYRGASAWSALAPGTSGYFLKTQGAAADPVWAVAGAGTVTSVTGTPPVVSSGGTTPAISMAAATGSVNGYLTSGDWTTFNGKQAAGNYLTYTPNQYGVVLSGAAYTASVLAPDSSTSKVLVSGGASANPSWAVVGVAGGGTGLATLTAHALYVGNGTSAPAAVSVGATNTVLHGSTGADPSFSAIVNGDITNSTIDLTTKVTGTLPVGNGGTGQASNWTQYGVVYASTTGVLANTAAGTSGYVLTSNGTSAPTFQAAGGGSGANTSKAFTQTTHGFAVGDWVYYTGSAYAKAKADVASTAEVVGVVSVVTDANNFTLVSVGYLTGLSGLTAGTTYFLSAATAGAQTATEPTSAGNISKPVFVADSTTTGFVIQSRGITAGAASGGTTSTEWTAIASPATLLGASVGTPTNVAIFKRRVGDTLEIKGYCVVGSVGGSAVLMTLPDSLTIDSAKMEVANTSGNVGPEIGTFTQANANQYGPIVSAVGTSTTVVYFGNTYNLGTHLTPTNYSTVGFSSVPLTFHFAVPISGWTNNN